MKTLLKALTIHCYVVSLAVGTGCDTRDATLASPGTSAIGIAKFRATEAENHVNIHGLDLEGNVVASIDLRVGDVSIPEEQLAGVGRELVVQIAGIEAKHASVGLTPLQLPMVDDPTLGALFADPFVEEVLADHGIAFTGRADDVLEGDPTYAHGGSCSGFTPSCQGTGSTACCLQHADGSGESHQKVVCENLATPSRATRACKGPNQSTSCGTAGPEGCKVCMSWTFSAAQYDYWTTYNSGSDACAFASCRKPGMSCVSHSGCCSGSCDNDDTWGTATFTCF